MGYLDRIPVPAPQRAAKTPYFVGAADDASELDADRRAEAVLRRLRLNRAGLAGHAGQRSSRVMRRVSAQDDVSPSTVSAAPGGQPYSRGSVIRRTLKVGEDNINQPGDLDDLEADIADYVQMLIDLGPPTVELTRAEVDQIESILEDGGNPSSARQIVALFRALSKDTIRIPPKDAWGYKDLLDRAFALGDFLGENPKVQDNLAEQHVRYVMPSSEPLLGGFGGAAVMNEDDNIHVASSILSLPTEGFMRTVVHETGHATFQRLLINTDKWTDDANRGAEQPDAEALDADGQKFYAAWTILKANRQYFFITDLHQDSPEAHGDGRRDYLAGKFTEFCAESFMHLALEKAALTEHVETLVGDGNTPGAVKTAWTDALAVLIKYEDQVLGAV